MPACDTASHVSARPQVLVYFCSFSFSSSISVVFWVASVLSRLIGIVYISVFGRRQICLFFRCHTGSGRKRGLPVIATYRAVSGTGRRWRCDQSAVHTRPDAERLARRIVHALPGHILAVVTEHRVAVFASMIHQRSVASGLEVIAPETSGHRRRMMFTPFVLHTFVILVEHERSVGRDARHLGGCGQHRFLSQGSNGLIAMAYDGEIYTLEPGGEPKKVAIEVLTDEYSAPSVINVTSGASEATALVLRSMIISLSRS